VSAKQRKKREKRRRHVRTRRRMIAGAGLGVTAALGAGSTAHAANFTVNSTAEPGDGTCDPSPGQCTLRDALDDAAANNNAPTVDNILFDSSVTGTITLNGTQLPTIDEPLYIDGPGANALTVSGNDASRILSMNTPDGTDVTVSGLTLTGGRASGVPGGIGGAIYTVTADLTIRDSTISGNSASGQLAGGAGVVSKYSTTIRDSTISNNVAQAVKYDDTAVAFAAGLTSGSATTIEGSTISGNEASATVAPGPDPDPATAFSLGGGLAVSSLTMERSTISGNDASANAVSPDSSVAYAGGVYASDSATIASSTIAGNSAGGELSSGGGVVTNDADTDPVLANTIVANNSADTGPDLFGPNDTFQAAFSLIANPGGASINATVADSNITGADPQLGPLADNGGPTQTRALPESSPAVDQGSSPDAADQRGLLRPVNHSAPDSTAAGANCADIGAFELQLAGGGAGPPCEPPDTNAPETQITKGPKDKLKLKKGKKKAKATFEFTGTDARAVASFQCSLDGGPFEPCASPDTEKVKKGKHEFEVRAVDAAGNVDPTPASDDWKVKRKKKKKK
jgi:hypothetical protein